VNRALFRRCLILAPDHLIDALQSSPAFTTAQRNLPRALPICYWVTTSFLPESTWPVISGHRAERFSLDETDTVAIRVLHVHFSRAPRLVQRFDRNGDTLHHEFRVERIHVFNNQVGHATRNPITGKRRDVHPNSVTGHAHVTGIRFRFIPAMGKFPLEAEPLAKELLRRGRTRHMEQRNRDLDHVALHLRNGHLKGTGCKDL
jgi:hypothetical protein